MAAPPTLQSTASPVPPRRLTASVVVAYDENGNRVVDPAEGVADISVRLVEIATNREIAHAFTDSRGYAGFEVVTDAPARLVVPYFGKAWGGAAGRRRLRLHAAPTPGNQPGLIP